MDATAAAAPAGLERIVATFEAQIGWCHEFKSPFTAHTLELVRDNLTNGGALFGLVVPWPGHPLADALPIRVVGALHMLVRTGRAPGLSPYYPPHGRAAWDGAAVAREIETAVAANAAYVRDAISGPPQTNEIGRSAVLMPAYCEIARRTGLPLRILEIGASAGLNLMWDRYAYRYGERFVGRADAPLTIAAEWRGPWPEIAEFPRVVERRGCDRSPIDLNAPEAAERLLSYVWPDHAERLSRLEAAIALAQKEKPPLEKADAGEWLERHLAKPFEGAATVVVHSIAWQYFSTEPATRARAAMSECGGRASGAAPLAWLSYEQHAGGAAAEVRLTLWPGGARQTLARAQSHGAWIEWLGAAGA